MASSGSPLAPAPAAERLARSFVGEAASRELRETLQQFIAAGGEHPRQRLHRLRRAAVTLLQLPEYQLC